MSFHFKGDFTDGFIDSGCDARNGDGPNPDASTLFSLITNAGTSAQAVQNFIQTHVVAWDAQNDQCQTTGDAALAQKRLDLYEVLYNQYHPDLNAKQGNESIYSYALSHGSVEELQLLQQEAKAKNESLDLSPLQGTVLKQGTTPLMLAAQNPSLPMTQYLIQNGADVNAGDSDGETALMYAAYGCNSTAITVLIQAGANVNANATNDNANINALGYAGDGKCSVDVKNLLIHGGRLRPRVEGRRAFARGPRASRRTRD